MRLSAILWAIFCIICSCSSSRLQPDYPYFTTTSFSYDVLMKQYENVPILKSAEIHRFVVHIANIEDNEKLKASGMTDYVSCQPIIDENGNIESIFVVKSVNAYLDSLAIDAVKRSRFKKIRKNQKPTKYSCLVDYLISNGEVLDPLVNLTRLRKPGEKSPTASPSRIVKEEELTQKPVLVEYASLGYPELAKKAGIQGTVVLQLLVNENGVVERVKVVKLLNPLLDELAIRSAYLRRYMPGEKAGSPVKTWIKVPFKYALRGR